MRNEYGTCGLCGRPGDLSTRLCQNCNKTTEDWFEQQIDLEAAYPDLAEAQQEDAAQEIREAVAEAARGEHNEAMGR